LLQGLERIAQRFSRRFADQQMHMLRLTT
jgi:hypothetical protein